MEIAEVSHCCPAPAPAPSRLAPSCAGIVRFLAPLIADLAPWRSDSLAPNNDGSSQIQGISDVVIGVVCLLMSVKIVSYGRNTSALRTGARRVVFLLGAGTLSYGSLHLVNAWLNYIDPLSSQLQLILIVLKILTAVLSIAIAGGLVRAAPSVLEVIRQRSCLQQNVEHLRQVLLDFRTQEKYCSIARLLCSHIHNSLDRDTIIMTALEELTKVLSLNCSAFLAPLTSDSDNFAVTHEAQLDTNDPSTGHVVVSVQGRPRGQGVVPRSDPLVQKALSEKRAIVVSTSEVVRHPDVEGRDKSLIRYHSHCDAEPHSVLVGSSTTAGSPMTSGGSTEGRASASSRSCAATGSCAALRSCAASECCVAAASGSSAVTLGRCSSAALESSAELEEIGGAAASGGSAAAALGSSVAWESNAVSGSSAASGTSAGAGSSAAAAEWCAVCADPGSSVASRSCAAARGSASAADGNHRSSAPLGRSVASGSSGASGSDVAPEHSFARCWTSGEEEDLVAAVRVCVRLPSVEDPLSSRSGEGTPRGDYAFLKAGGRDGPGTSSIRKGCAGTSYCALLKAEGRDGPRTSSIRKGCAGTSYCALLKAEVGGSALLNSEVGGILPVAVAIDKESLGGCTISQRRSEESEMQSRRSDIGKLNPDASVETGAAAADLAVVPGTSQAGASSWFSQSLESERKMGDDPSPSSQSMDSKTQRISQPAGPERRENSRPITDAASVDSDASRESSVTGLEAPSSSGSAQPVGVSKVQRLKETGHLEIEEDATYEGKKDDQGSAMAAAAAAAEKEGLSNERSWQDGRARFSVGVLVFVLPSGRGRKWRGSDLTLIDKVRDQLEVALSHAAVVDVTCANMIRIAEACDALRREQERHQAVIKSHQHFLTVMNQQLEAPLKFVVNGLQFLKKASMAPELTDLVTTAARSSEMLYDVINDIKTFEALKCGKHPLNLGPFLFSELMNDVKEAVRQHAETCEVVISYDCDANIPAVLVGDRYQLFLVLRHLIINACKFGLKKPVVVTVNVRYEREQVHQETSVTYTINSPVGLEGLSHQMHSACQLVTSSLIQSAESGTSGLSSHLLLGGQRSQSLIAEFPADLKSMEENDEKSQWMSLSGFSPKCDLRLPMDTVSGCQAVPQNSSAEFIRLSGQLRDLGIGLQDSLIPDLFKEFVQGDMSTTRRHGGIGLGLSICQAICQHHGGHVNVQSEGVGQGTTVSFNMKFGIHNAKRVHSEKEQLLLGISPGMPCSAACDLFHRLGKTKLLLYDEDPDSHADLANLIISLGCIIHTASSRVECLRHLERTYDDDHERYDVLLISLPSPRLHDNRTLLEEIQNTLKVQWKSKTARLSRATLVIVDPAEQMETTVNCLMFGVDTILTKPVSRGQLGRVMCGLLRL
ncbi:hypothetical protein CBR_g11036 [Chara braunii]|uniref:Histidine kinase domain-containing protein n=1 Tax=Chara braunii TaxID=69332 RepID=A0A388KQ98_CHABU|nr:hypothetical protein CBR_g11036 [Chara braunii]|eukprot:GBG72103.1 hypothetical protein CBR_g11036 [Chara braunii]